MAKDSKIEWTEHTFNPWWGCVRVSPACKHCYAESFAHRLGLSVWGKRAERRMQSDSYWRQPLNWNRAAEHAGRRARVFCASMADVFEERAELDPVRLRLWSLIAETPSLDWLLLTKRPQHVTAMVPWGTSWPVNIWLGATAETQLWANRRLPELLKIPAQVHFASCEPLLGPIDLTEWLDADPSGAVLDWVIAGGESGHHARPTNPEWFRSIRDQCANHDVAFHFKQWGNWVPSDPGLLNGHMSRTLRDNSGTPVIIVNLGKKASGRSLDGREWSELPVHP